MNFLGVGPFEVTLALIVAVLAFGPEDLTKSLAQAAVQLWRRYR